MDRGDYKAEFHRRMRILLGGDYKAVMRDHPDILEPIVPESGRGLLHTACELLRTVQVQVLLSVPGIDVNRMAADGETALHIAARLGAADIVKLMLNVANGSVDTNLKDARGYSTAPGSTWW